MNHLNSAAVKSSLVLLIAIVTAIAVTGMEQHPARSERVAVLLDLQGAQATLGRPAMNGFTLGLEQAGLEEPVPFSVLIDTRTDQEVTATAAAQVASIVSIAAGFTDNDSVLTAGPFFQVKRVPFLSIGATDPALPEEVGNSIFLVPFGDNTQAAAAAEFGMREFGAAAAVLWDSTSQYSRTLPRYFQTRFEQLGGSVAADMSYDGGCDITGLGLQVASLSPQPDFVYLAGLPDCIGNVVSSLRAAGVTEPIVGGDGLDTPNLIDTATGRPSNVWFTTHAWLSEQTGTPEAKAFIAAYRNAYGAAPSDAFAALGYDAARLMVDALRRAQNGNRILEALEETEGFDGVTGTISYRPGSHVPLKTVWIIEVQNGEKSLASAFIPDSVPPPIVNSP